MKSFESTPRPSVCLVFYTSPMLEFTEAEHICLSLCLFVFVFVSLIVCIYTHLCWWPSQVFLWLWQFSAWSLLMRLSVYLLSQCRWFIHIYISRKWQRTPTSTLRGGNGVLSVISLHAPGRRFLWRTCGTHSQTLRIWSDMKWSQPQERWHMPLGR